MSASISVDEFAELEHRVVRAIEIVRYEREARATAEAEVAALRAELEVQAEAYQRASDEAETQISAMNQEREIVRMRIERLILQTEELV